MKSSHIIPVATGLIGFSLAWIAKPGGTSVPGPSGKTEQAAPVRAPRSGPGDRPDATSGKRPTEVRAGDFPLAEQAEKGPKSREEAKMLRLTEALALSVDQQGAIIQLVTDAQATASSDISALEDLTIRGKAIEDGLREVLTPDQFEKFQEIQSRERDNRTELRAQRLLADTIEYIDLSPEQREEVMSRLRQKSKADMQTIPAAATLLFDKSILPTGGKELSPDGVLLLAKMGEKIDSLDPMEVHESVMNRHKQDLEDILKCFDGILTPGQMGQYHAALAEQRETLERVRKDMVERRRRDDPAASVRQDPPMPVQEVIPDDEVSDEDLQD